MPFAIKLLISLALAATLNPATLFAGISKLQLRNLPPVSGFICDDFALAEAARLKKFVGESFGPFEIVDARCVSVDMGDDFGQWNLEISYSSKWMLPIVTTASSTGPGYKTQETCEDNLAVEQSLFTENTKLKVFTGYCMIPLYEGYTWNAQIIGFGAPDLSPFSTDVEIFGSVVGHTEKSFTEMLRDKFNFYGMDLAQTSTAGHFAYFTLAMRYYGKTPIRMESQTIVKYTSDSSCLSNLSSLEAAIASAGVPEYGVFCTTQQFNGQHSEIIALVNSNNRVLLVGPETVYTSETACASNIPSVVKHYVEQLGRDIKGGYCNMEEPGAYTIIMLEKK